MFSGSDKLVGEKGTDCSFATGIFGRQIVCCSSTLSYAPVLKPVALLIVSAQLLLRLYWWVGVAKTCRRRGEVVLVEGKNGESYALLVRSLHSASVWVWQSSYSGSNRGQIWRRKQAIMLAYCKVRCFVL